MKPRIQTDPYAPLSRKKKFWMVAVALVLAALAVFLFLQVWPAKAQPIQVTVSNPEQMGWPYPAPDANAGGPYWRMTADQRITWWNGFALYFSMAQGAPYRPPQWNLNDEQKCLCVDWYWGERIDNWLEASRPGSPLIGYGYEIARRMREAGLDLRNALATLELESTCGLGSSNYFGIVCYGLAGGFSEQLGQYIEILSRAQAQRGPDPYGLAGFYNCDRPAYCTNWQEIFYSVR